MNDLIGHKIKLGFRDPDAGYGSNSTAQYWPTLHAEIVAMTEGLYGKVWYLVKLLTPLPSGFNPLDSNLPDATIPIWNLLLSPSPPVPTSDVPSDFIGQCILKKQKVPVLVSLGIERKNLPKQISREESHSRFPTICQLFWKLWTNRVSTHRAHHPIMTKHRPREVPGVRAEPRSGGFKGAESFGIGRVCRGAEGTCEANRKCERCRKRKG